MALGINRTAQRDSSGNHRANSNLPSFILLFVVIGVMAVPTSPLSTMPAATALASSNVSNSDGSSTTAQIATPGSDTVYLVWQDLTPGNFDIFAATSTNGGESYGDPVNVSNNEGSSTFAQVALSGSDLHVVWQDATPGNNDIMYSSSSGGESFSSPINVSNDTSSSTSPRIAVGGDGTAYVVWQDDGTNFDIFMASSTDGETFSSPVNVSDDSDTSTSPQIAASDGGIHVVWLDSGDSTEIFAASSADGAIFSDPINISNSDGTSSLPRIAVSDSGSVNVVWQDDTPGDFDIMFSSSSNGTIFSSPVNISENDGTSLNARLVASGTEVLATWQDTTGNSASDIFLATSTDGGLSFGAPVNISSSDESSSANAQISLSGSTIFLVWQEITGENIDIISVVSSDGESFGCAINVSNNEGASTTPQIMSSSGTAHIAWQDATPGNLDVFARTLDSSSAAPAENTISTSSPKWDLDQVDVSGGVANAAGSDTITVDWGDGSTTSGIEISGCSWGPTSHVYPSTAVDENPNKLAVKLVAGNGTELTTLSESDISVQAHDTELILDSIDSVLNGTTMTAKGLLTDADSGDPISGGNITFTGNGATGILPSVLTGPDGSFEASGNATAAVGSDHVVQAHHTPDSSLYSASASAEVTYDTFGPDAAEYEVMAGQDVFVNLTGFSFPATVTFENVTDPGSLFISECDTPASDRFISPSPLDMCLAISPAVDIGTDSSVNITMTFNAADIPDGNSASQISIFHEDGSGNPVDVTSSRSLGDGKVTATVDTFSDFYAAIAVHGDKPLGAHRADVFVGDGNVVSLRGISDDSPASASASFDDDSYTVGDEAELTVVDENANADADQIDTTITGVKSDTSDPFFVLLVLQETGPNTNTFAGKVNLVGSTTNDLFDQLQVSTGSNTLSTMITTGPRFQAVIDGVEEAGIAEMSEIFVDATSGCFAPVGGALVLTLIDASLSEEGLITATISYANAVLQDSEDPSQLKLFFKEESTWIDITSSVDTSEKVVTGQASADGSFSLGFESECGGGAGGGFGRGLIVDAVASVAKKSTGGGGGGGGGSGGGGSVVTQSGTLGSNYFAENPTERVAMSSQNGGGIVFADSLGNTVSSINVGSDVTVVTSFKNLQGTTQHYLYIVEVFDSQGIVVDLDTFSGIVQAGEALTLKEGSFTAEGKAGEYTVKIFVLDEAERGSIFLAPVIESQITVVSAT